MKRAIFSILFVVPLAAQSPLCDRLRALTQDPSVAAAHWGLQLTDIKGVPLCSINEGQLFRPASNNKIFTTATTLALLGPAHTVTTRLEAEGTVAGDTLTGNLLLIGAGDANFGSHNTPYLPFALRPKNSAPEPPTIADIEAFADSVAARGIRIITGNIVGDDTAFSWEPYPPDWGIDDMVYGYGAPIAALTIHDNAIDFSVTPVAPTPSGSSKAVISLVPDVPYYQLDASVYSVAFRGGCDDRLTYQRAVGSKTLTIFGDIAPASKPCHQAIAIEDPAEYAALALKLALARRNIRVAGSAMARHHEVRILGGVHTERPDGDPSLRALFADAPSAGLSCEAQRVDSPGQPTPLPRIPLASHTSPTLLEDITYTNKVSQNQHAEIMLRLLAATFSCTATQRDGLHIIREFLLHAGIQPGDLALYDGSGLSTHDLVTPRALATFLTFAAAQPWFAGFKSSLPQAGVDSSLSNRFKQLPAGRLFAKTGTLGETRALSGYLTTNSGRQLIFSLMVDTHLPGDILPGEGAPPDRTMMDRIVETISAQ